MIYRIFTLLSFFLIPFRSIGQYDAIQRIETLVTQKLFAEANQLADSILSADSTAVDAWMWKGNIQYYAWDGLSAAVTLSHYSDENVYHTDAMFMRSRYAYVPKPVADSCAKYFTRALTIDSTRSDILAGLCFIYSISGNANALINTLPALVRHSDMDPMAYRDYAYNLNDIGEQKKGLAVFEKICSLFPENGNLLSDLAAYYFDIGDIQHCEQTIERSIQKNDLDEISYANAFFLFGIMERYADAYHIIQKQSALRKDDLYKIYGAFLQRFVPTSKLGESICGTTLVQTDDDAAFEYAEILCGPVYADDMNGYSLLLNVSSSEAYHILIHHYFTDRYPEAFVPAYRYAESLTYCGRFADAVQQFERTDTTLADQDALFDFHFYYAWALYQLQEPEANVHWKYVLDSPSAYYVSAACYFLGKDAMLSNAFDDAKAFFTRGASYSNDSKYGVLCAQLLREPE